MIDTRRPSATEGTAPDIELLTQTADFVLKYGFLAVGPLSSSSSSRRQSTSLPAPNVSAQGTAVFGVAFVICVRSDQPHQGGRPAVDIGSARDDQRRGSGRAERTVRANEIGFVAHRSGLHQARVRYPAAKHLQFPVFLFVTADAPGCLAVALESNGPNKSDTSQLFNVVPVSADDMAPNIEIVIEVGKDQDKSILNVWRGGCRQEIRRVTRFQPLKDLDPGCASASGTRITIGRFSRALLPSRRLHRRRYHATTAKRRRSLRAPRRPHRAVTKKATT